MTKIPSALELFPTFPSMNLILKNYKKYNITANIDNERTVFLRKESSDALVFEQIFAKNSYRFSSKILQHFDLTSVKNVIDLGANVGMFPLYLTKICPNIETILMVEPDKDNMQMIIDSIDKNINIYDNITIYTVNNAVYGKQCQLKLTNGVQVENVLTNSYQWAFSVEEVTSETEGQNFLNALTVNDLMFKYFNNEIIDILKMDIEGSEISVFENDTRWLDNVRMLIIETHEFLYPETDYNIVYNKLKKWTKSKMWDNQVFLNPKFL